jgi:hypothetical protein
MFAMSEEELSEAEIRDAVGEIVNRVGGYSLITWRMPDDLQSIKSQPRFCAESQSIRRG